MPTVPQDVTVADGDYVKIVARCYALGQVSLNVYWYSVGSSAGPVSYKTLLPAWIALAFPVYTPCMHTSALFVDATLQVVAPNNHITPTLFAAAIMAPGTALGNPQPQQVAGLITRRVNLPKNNNRGRVYIPFPSTAGTSTVERPSAAYIALLTTLQQALLPTTAPANVGGQQWSPVLYKLGAVAGNALISALPSNKWATQKRRGDYGIPNVIPGNS
jgi:hypothetical protein